MKISPSFKNPFCFIEGLFFGSMFQRLLRIAYQKRIRIVRLTPFSLTKSTDNKDWHRVLERSTCKRIRYVPCYMDECVPVCTYETEIFVQKIYRLKEKKIFHSLVIHFPHQSENCCSLKASQSSFELFSYIGCSASAASQIDANMLQLDGLECLQLFTVSLYPWIDGCPTKKMSCCHLLIFRSSNDQRTVQIGNNRSIRLPWLITDHSRLVSRIQSRSRCG